MKKRWIILWGGVWGRCPQILCSKRCVWTFCQHCSRIRCPLFLKFFVYLLALFLSFFYRSHKIFLEKDKKRTLIIVLNGKQIPPPLFLCPPTERRIKGKQTGDWWLSWWFDGDLPNQIHYYEECLNCCQQNDPTIVCPSMTTNYFDLAET